MPKTLLAVDDSATMRKVLEITFSGEDFRVVTAESGSAALGKMSEEPAVVVLDTSLPGEDAYAIAKQLRAKDGRAAIVLLSSRYNAHDAAKAKDAGADDYMDKPFDTQQMIDKVRKAMLARESGAGVAAAAAPAAKPAAAATGPTSTAPSMQSPFQPKPAPAVNVAPSPQPAPVAAKPAFSPAQRTHTLSFEGTPAPGAAAPKVVSPVAGGAAARPEATAKPPAVAPAAPPPAADIGGHVNGHLAGKLGDLGLNPQQVEAVLALSREVVERVVWEVVPQLAETIIKEEISRLTKEG